MARKRNSGQSDEQPERWPGDADDEQLRPRDTESTGDNETAADESMDARESARDAEHVADAEHAAAADDDEPEAATLPTASDLASRGFTPDEVQRLEVVSDRQAQSDESQLAAATLRRLRFTRWLIEHGMLDEWSA